MVDRDWLHRFVGVEIEMIVVLVTFLGHVSLLNRSRVNAQSAMERTSCRVSASSVLMLCIYTLVKYRKFRSRGSRELFFNVRISNTSVSESFVANRRDCLILYRCINFPFFFFYWILRLYRTLRLTRSGRKILTPFLLPLS